MFDIEPIVDCKNELGECPIWCAKENVLWWIDISKPSLFRFNPQTKQTNEWSLPKAIGSFALRKSGGFLMGFRKGIANMQSPDSPVEWMDLPSDLHPDGRFNDGKCDALGRFWVGTMDKNVTEPIGELYRFDLQLKPTKMDNGFTISNGISWSPDNKTMYFADSPARKIYAYDFDLAQGAIANRRVFAAFDETPGRPDGCTVDSEGFIWSARVRGGRIDRYDPAGKIERSIVMPVSRPTSLVFGGPSMETLFVTTSTLTLTTEDLTKQPYAGAIFAIETGIKGHLEHAFAG